MLLFITSFSQQGRKYGRKTVYGIYQFFDSVYFQKIPYSASASIVHAGFDTLVSSPTYGKLVRKTASGFTNLTSFVSQNNWKTFYSDGSGDVQELSIGASGTYLKSAGSSAAPTWVNPLKYKSMTLETPGAAEDFGLWRTPMNITIDSVSAVLVGSGSPSVTINIAFGTNRTGATNVFSSGTAITNVTTGQTINSGFNDATIPIESWIWFVSTAQSGTVTQITVTIYYHED